MAQSPFVSIFICNFAQNVSYNEEDVYNDCSHLADGIN